ncbi:MAG: efflux RND transporter periplasmic adaptor subunit [Dysgonamonadaceae bacterium]|jgi:HlyD family secretion protein|nr:efflux RND transporter periplasmic adaptor subunit [Dysgonamonadaceae bacterium]
MKKRTVTIIITASIAVVGLLAFMLTGNKEVQYQTETAIKGNLSITVMATGYIQPVEEIEVGTQVSGVIEKIYADYNSHVKKGQLLAELDKLTLQEKLNQATAQLSRAQSELTLSNRQYDRVKQLYEAKAATEVAFEEALNRKEQAEMVLKDAQANLSQAKVNLSYASIYSPIDGVVLKRAVNIGQTVAAMFSTPTFFTIAEDLTKMQVEADVDEADLGQVKLGQHVTFTVDAYPGETFAGTVSQIRISPKVTNNVVTYTVIVNAPNPEEKLFPGMTASIRINIQSEEGILVPVEALHVEMHGRASLRVKSNGNIEERNIQTGISDGVFVVARSGVEEGEEVIVSEKGK